MKYIQRKKYLQGKLKNLYLCITFSSKSAFDEQFSLYQLIRQNIPSRIICLISWYKAKELRNTTDLKLEETGKYHLKKFLICMCTRKELYCFNFKQRILVCLEPNKRGLKILLICNCNRMWGPTTNLVDGILLLQNLENGFGKLVFCVYTRLRVICNSLLGSIFLLKKNLGMLVWKYF